MTSASPADLVVTFRSLPRRLREAQADTPAENTSGPAAGLHLLLGESGRLVGANADPVAIADAIDAVPADEWDDATLDRLRQIGLELGRLLRQIESAGDNAD